MKKTSKKGFTIVELVIVIAVIAILAAVLIPTFSSLIKKAKLSSDMQAVREMNQALSVDEKLHGKPADIETAMQVLANAGYNSKNWVCLTEGYMVYWDSKENKCVLYNSSTAEVEYPAEYDRKIMTTAAPNRFQIYNNNYESAIGTDLSLGSAVVKPEGIDLGSDQAKQDIGLVIESLTGDNVNAALKTSLGLTGDDIRVYSSKVTTSDTYSSGTYAKVTAAAVGEGEFTSDSKAVKPNLYTIETVIPANATPQVIEAAQKAAGEYVYSIFVQMNSTSTQADDVSIVVKGGTTLNLSSHEWQAVKSYSGYFGTSDAANPVTIEGMKLSDATGHALMKPLAGSNSKYFMTGFIGTLCGNAVVENLKFTDLTIKDPGRDYGVANGKDNRNTVGIIGAILPDDKDPDKAIDVTVRNITVDSTCKIIGNSGVGGIVGYIGAESGWTLNGKVTIDNCNFAGTVESLDAKSGSNYAPAGGIVGFTVRTNKIAVCITNCVFSGTVKGYHAVGGVIGNIGDGKFYVKNVDVSGAKFENKGLCEDGNNRSEIGWLTANFFNGGGSIKYFNCTPTSGYPAVLHSASLAKEEDFVLPVNI